MKARIFAIALAATPAFSLMAEASEELAKEYVELPAVQKMIDDMFAPEQFTSAMTASLPAEQADPEKMKKVGDLIAESINGLRPMIENAMIAGSDEVYSDEELQAMIDFYSTEIGTSILAKTPQLMEINNREIMPTLMQELQKIIPEVMAIMTAE